MRARHILIRTVAVAALLAAAGCASKDPYTGSLPDDYTVRHPIHVTRGAATFDLLPGGGPAGLTDRQVADIQEFGRDWQKRGRGLLVINVPTGGDPVADRQSAHASKEIRRVLAAMGVPGRSIRTERYPAGGPDHLAPVRLEFPVLEAKVPHECGQWPDDMGYSDPGSSNRNSDFYNFGCAYQQNLAAQVEDPEDFIRPRAETPASATRRADVLDKFGRGRPTVTSYPKTTIATQE